MAELRPIARSVTGADYLLGRKLDSIPFSGYHVLIIAVLGLVGFIEGYDLVMTGSLLVPQRAPMPRQTACNAWRHPPRHGAPVHYHAINPADPSSKNVCHLPARMVWSTE